MKQLFNKTSTKLVIGLAVGLVLGLLASAESQQGAAPVKGEVAVTNFPETQDVVVTNSRFNPVPVAIQRSSSEVTLNTILFEVPAGESETFDAEIGFQSLDAFFFSVTGADRDMFIFFQRSGANILGLRGVTDSGIGQEDYTFSIAQPIRVDGVTVSCLETSGSCKVHVSVTGYF